MASAPGYSASGRARLSDAGMTSIHQAENTNESTTTTNITSQSAGNSELADEPVLLNRPSSAETATHEPTMTDKSNLVNPSSSPSPPPNNDDEPRKCWICYADETEDTPLTSEWRSPCPCALTAHEACLLDWLADLENPRSRKRNGASAKMVCPQCKSEIVVSRPRSYIVEIVRLFERVAGRLVLPGMVFTLAGTVWAGCCVHGVYSMYFVFGTEEARHILEESIDGSWNSGLNLGLPLIPMCLILTRTRYSESLLAAIPFLLLVTRQPVIEPAATDLWPPTPAATFAALPYVKRLYSLLYDRLFGKLEKKWIREVQPRQSDINEFDDNAPPNHPEPIADEGEADDENGRVLMEIDFELQVGVRGDDGAQGLFEFNNGGQGGDRQQQQAGPNGGGAEGQGLGLGRRDDLVHETTNLADLILGALAFPAISASMGGLLRHVLPRSWTAASTAGRPGLLQTRWGRSVVGGCVFVLLKDALVLYCRWKLAQTHRRRKVLNYDRAKKHIRASSRATAHP
ncbi:RING finger domain protein [Aspergillus saccharolyticus JOP 1030-1]|uniref:RING-CH-type domain-containing protein n=1 Tax=Aspergillus saccharolyticus JOP 1030-1 TaxID=1450539 RepID=A0A318ZA50_9EURO|nr:hypothetical protein BP01DRAFT_358570 [Aspergillus saccharolyticus JOP 1030-1]PYH43317.1 hypothetical protein BP01DRAFT_358570 [Aspergillus saccharolyticus JOP 1030-1]